MKKKTVKFSRGSNARGRRKFRRRFGYTPIARRPDVKKEKVEEVEWPSPKVQSG